MNTEDQSKQDAIDAARYRFLRDRAFLDSQNSYYDFAALEALTGGAFDNRIDALMGEEAATQKLP